MRETETITALRGLFAASARQQNALFTCDAELLKLDGGLYGLSLDEFSPEEDAWPSSDPEALGRNLAVAVLADLLAAGCRTEFYLQALVAPQNAEDFCRELCLGVRDVLEKARCFLLGGDLGQAANWRYTGFAMGRAGERGPLTRLLPQKELALWVTGGIGDGNSHALAATMPAFETRFDEASAIHRVAEACIDTSGGLADSLLMLSRCNPEHAFFVDDKAVPYDGPAAAGVKTLGMPERVLAFGGAGEYELLFAAPEGAAAGFATRIGTVLPARDAGRDAGPGLFWNGRKLAELPDPRAMDREEYLRRILEAAKLCAL